MEEGQEENQLFLTADTETGLPNAQTVRVLIHEDPDSILPADSDPDLHETTSKSYARTRAATETSTRETAVRGTPRRSQSRDGTPASNEEDLRDKSFLRTSTPRDQLPHEEFNTHGLFESENELSVREESPEPLIEGGLENSWSFSTRGTNHLRDRKLDEQQLSMIAPHLFRAPSHRKWWAELLLCRSRVFWHYPIDLFE